MPGDDILRTILFILACLFALSAGFCQVSVEHTTTPSFDSKPILVTVYISSDSNLKVFDLGEFMPASWQVESWKINGYNGQVSFEEMPQSYIGKQYNLNHWQLKDGFSGKISLEYTISGKKAGSYEFSSVWLYPNSFGTGTYKLDVK